MLQEPEVKARLLDLGFVPGGDSPSEFQKQVLSDQARWADLIKKAAIKPESERREGRRQRAEKS